MVVQDGSVGEVGSGGEVPHHEGEEVARLADLHQILGLFLLELPPGPEVPRSSECRGETGQPQPQADHLHLLAGGVAAGEVQQEVRRGPGLQQSGQLTAYLPRADCIVQNPTS